MALINMSQGKTIAPTVRVASTFWRRLKGLLGTDSLPAGQALIIMPCSAIHTFGMKYYIDALFLDKNHRIVKIIDTIKPNRVVTAFGATCVVEVAAGTARQLGIVIGDMLQWDE